MRERHQQLEFTDCVGCGKRVSQRAAICRHCQTPLHSWNNNLSTDRSASNVATAKSSEEDDFQSDSEYSLDVGGYGVDDFDDNLDNEFDQRGTGRGIWFYVGWLMVFVFAVLALLPVVL